MKNYEKKLRYLLNRQLFRCPICENFFKKDEFQLHHRLNNAKWRRKKYPLFIDSMLNLVPLCANCHMENGRYMQISDYRAEKYELFLQKHPLFLWII